LKADREGEIPKIGKEPAEEEKRSRSYTGHHHPEDPDNVTVPQSRCLVVGGERDSDFSCY